MATDYGTDLSCVDDLTPEMREVPSNSIRTLAEAIARRLSTPRGFVIDDQEYGYNVADLLNGPIDSRSSRFIASQVKAEVLKDERVDTCSVEVNITGKPSAYNLEIKISGVGAPGPFTLVVGVDGLTTKILESSVD